MQEIETLHEEEDSSLATVSFRWQGMNISLALMSDRGERKSISVTVGAANYAECIRDWRAEKWTISSVDSPSSDAPVFTTSDGLANLAIEPSTGEKSD